jgi:SAM-dependent methyltransferase
MTGKKARPRPDRGHKERFAVKPNVKKILKGVWRFIPVPIQRLVQMVVFHRKDRFRYKNDGNVFQTIYANGMWGKGESRSGGGSYISTTVKVREALPRLWEQYGVKTFLDVPCGDYNWMKEVPKNGVTYIGGDIVEELVAANNERYGGAGVSFQKIDITKDALPRADMIFCKDCLQHLSYQNAKRALRNFVTSSAVYLLTTSYPLTWKNWDIFDGDYHALNLRKAPFNLPEPLEKIMRPQRDGMWNRTRRCFCTALLIYGMW